MIALPLATHTLSFARVVYRIDDETEDGGNLTRYGFAYGTLPGHPERSEESFVIEWHERDEVRLTITVFSVGATWYTRAVGPLTPWLQRLYAACCAAALRRAARGGGAAARPEPS